MARKDITDLQVCRAVQNFWDTRRERALAYLVRTTNEPEKVCWRAMERTCDRGFIEYGTGLGTSWLTDKGKELLKKAS